MGGHEGRGGVHSVRRELKSRLFLCPCSSHATQYGVSFRPGGTGIPVRGRLCRIWADDVLLAERAHPGKPNTSSGWVRIPFIAPERPFAQGRQLALRPANPIATARQRPTEMLETGTPPLTFETVLLRVTVRLLCSRSSHHVGADRNEAGRVRIDLATPPSCYPRATSCVPVLDARMAPKWRATDRCSWLK